MTTPFIQKSIAVLSAALAIGGTSCIRTARTDNVLTVGSTKQLFLDDRVIDRIEKVRRTLHRPVRYSGNPIIEADRPWENGPEGFDVSLGGGSVLYDEEEHIFKMWYRTGNDVNAYSVCYATSKDGLHWQKPNLGLYDFHGSRQNNLLRPAVGGTGLIRRPNIIKDYQEPDPEKRYKMLYMDEINSTDRSIERHLNRTQSFGGTGNEGNYVLRQAYSADGIYWRMNAGEYVPFKPPLVPNGVLFGWDPRRKLFVHYHKMTVQKRADVDGRTGRSDYSFVSTTSPDFERWGNTRVMPRKIWDETPSNDPREPGSDTACILYTDDLYVGIVHTGTSVLPEDVPDNMWDIYRWTGEDGGGELVMSRDGENWHRVAAHWLFLRPGLPGTWDQMVAVAAKPIVHGNEILIYYFGTNIDSEYTRPTHPQHHLLNKIVDGQRMGNAIGLARMRLDGFASLDGYEPQGTVLTHALKFEGNRLIINIRAPEKPFGSEAAGKEPYGVARIEIADSGGRPLPGYTAMDCDPFTGDDNQHVVTWRGNSDLKALAGKPIRLRIHLNNAALYSFQFTGAEARSQFNPECPGCRGRPNLK